MVDLDLAAATHVHMFWQEGVPSMQTRAVATGVMQRARAGAACSFFPPPGAWDSSYLQLQTRWGPWVRSADEATGFGYDHKRTGS